MSRPVRAAGLLSMLLCSAALAGGLGENEKKTGQMSENQTVKPNDKAPAGDAAAIVRVSGRVRLVGSGVFPELVISGEGREWFISKDEQSKLFDYQQRLVTVEGVESYVDLTFANGLPAGRRYTLKNLKIINIDQ